MCFPMGGAAGRVRTGDLHLGKVTRYQLRYNRMRAFGGIRTRSLVRTKDALHLVSFEGMRTAGGSRTRNIPILIRAPLSVGLPRHELRVQESNLRAPRPKRGHGRQRRTPERERLTGVEPATPLWKSGMSPWTPQPRRPCRDRTGLLLAENEARSPLLQRSKSARPPDRTGNLPGFNRALLPSELGGHGWTCGDSNPGPSVCRTDALPTALQALTSGTGESNAVSSAPKADGSTSSLAPDWCPDRRHLRADGRVHLSCCPLWS
jgi:hypothetical protein